MSAYRLVQVIGLFLVILAGYLWSHRLADQVYRQSLRRNDQFVNDQLEIVRGKVKTKDDPVELISFGRKFLDAGNAQFAVIPLERATRLAPKIRDGWYLLGYSYLRITTDDEGLLDPVAINQYRQRAELALQEAAKIDPAHKPTRQLLEQL